MNGSTSATGATAVAQPTRETPATPVQPEAGVQSLGPTSVKFNIRSEDLWRDIVTKAHGSTDALVLENDLNVAKQQAARLNAQVAIYHAIVTQLLDELAVARQAVETARQTTSTPKNAETAIQKETRIETPQP